MIKTYSAFSVNVDAFLAGKEAASEVLVHLPEQPQIVWVFGAISYDQRALIRGVKSVLPETIIIGCTTDGEISNQGLTVDSVVLLGLISDQLEFTTAIVRDLGKNSFEAGKKLAEQFNGEPTEYIQIFSDGLTGNGSEIIKGIQSVLGINVKIAGGTAGDGSLFQKTYQYFNDEILTDALIGVAFVGEFKFGTGVQSGWTTIGMAKQVTKAEKNVLYELDGKPALEVYEKFLGQNASLLPAVGVEYPLGLLGPSGDVDEDDYYLCRATMGVDRVKGTVTFAGDIPEGAFVKMTMGSESDILQAVQKAASQALERLKNGNASVKPAAVFFYSCMARKIVLGSRTNEEISAIKKIVGDDVPIIGFYSYGEYAPAGKEMNSHLHNETATLTLISE